MHQVVRSVSVCPTLCVIQISAVEKELLTLYPPYHMIRILSQLLT